MDKNKTFDAVEMMREIRENLSQKYWNHPDILKKEMQAIREKYHFRLKRTPVNQETDLIDLAVQP